MNCACELVTHLRFRQCSNSISLALTGCSSLRSILEFNEERLAAITPSPGGPPAFSIDNCKETIDFQQDLYDSLGHAPLQSIRRVRTSIYATVLLYFGFSFALESLGTLIKRLGFQMFLNGNMRGISCNWPQKLHIQLQTLLIANTDQSCERKGILALQWILGAFRERGIHNYARSS